MSLEQNQPTV